MSKAAVWRPLNVEFEQEAEEEVDDTQEIQIEEALKLYQTALKYHSEGPQSFDKTAAAYQALFASEIFKYNESLSEYQRHEVFGDTLVFDTILEEDFDAGPTQAVGAAESAPNTLPQILHLSYKNHGQFLLESMQHWLTQHGTVPELERWNSVRGALNYFAEALDKEDTDLDLWLRAASVSAMLGSKRLTRYCLEAVLDGNDEQWESLLRLPGLEEGFAGQQLRELVEALEDSVSLMQAPLSSMRKKKLSETLRKRLNPYPSAPLPAEVANVDIQTIQPQGSGSVILNPLKWNWAGVGEMILQQYTAESRGLTDNIAPGSSIKFTIPAKSETPERNDPEGLAAEVAQPASEEPTESASVIPVTAVTNTSVTKDDCEDTIMEEQDGNATTAEETIVVETAATRTETPVEAPSTLSRKRSTDSAGLPETADGGRSRSKRIRARDIVTEPSAGGDGVAQEGNKLLEQQLEPYMHADQCLYEIVKDIYSRLDIDGMREPQHLRNLVTALPTLSATDPLDKAACDMFSAIQGGNPKAAHVLLSTESFDLVGVTREAGLNAFLGYAKAGTGQACAKPILQSQKLGTFARAVNEEWLSIKEVAFAWMESLLARGNFCTGGQESDTKSQTGYIQFRWDEDLKRNVVQIIVNVDEYIYERMLDRINDLNKRMLDAHVESRDYKITEFDTQQIEIVQTLFELHLDIYSLIKHPHSQVDSTTQTLQSDRLERWSALARDSIQLRSHCSPDVSMDDLALRHIWASVFQMSVNDDLPPEHVLAAIAELKAIFETLGDRTVQVQNNAIMPELCVAAVDRELVRISMKDFFLKVFDHDEKDPVTVVESLEPILEDEGSSIPNSEAPQAGSDTIADDEGSSVTLSNGTNQVTEAQDDRPSPIFEMRKFLDAANVNVRLSLWHRLREAYEAIEYPPKVVSCHLRSIETLVADFKTTKFQELSPIERQVKLLTRFRVIDDQVTKILQLMRSDKTAFDCLSYDHVQSSMSAIAQLLHILSAADMFRDLIRIGHATMPRIESLPNQAFTTMSIKLDDMHLRLWMVQYFLLREALSQNAESFPTPTEDLFEFLRHVHHATGVRHFCHMSTRQFLRLAKDEIIRLDDIIDANSRDTELCQVLHDLYGLKLFIEPLECQEFFSTPEFLDKKTALGLLPFVIAQARKMDMKDLPKTELRGAIEKVHTALGRPKQHKDISFNHKIVTAWFKSPINPVSLFSCLKGVGSLSTKHIPADEAVAASLGWHFLMGNINLSKFRSQKRMTQGPTEDLNYAQAFFLQDLEYTIDRWETWYRLAQANDLQLEEAVSWNADKLNSNSVELINCQRAAINCYTMAVACAVRDADAQSQDQIAQMYTEFGNRMYASSREPFRMEAFQFRETEKKFFNLPYSTGTSKGDSFSPLYLYTTWKFCSTLFKRAIRGNPNKWWNYYMLGKCSWKMWAANDTEIRYNASVGAPPPPDRAGPTFEIVVDSLITAIETLPSKKGRSGEPILEPHYKLVSVVHKLFQRGAIDHKKGAELLASTSYSQNVGVPEHADDWERYVLAVLKALKSADKSSWHHRIIARSANVLFDGGKDAMLAHAAKHELMQQMFTKTMAVQVWKPENERPGRHFVYTTRYTKFFVSLLDMTGDKANLEALAKRVRRKTADFFEHSKLWQELCLRYLKMLRKLGKIPDGQEDSAFKSVNHEEFNTVALRLEAWCQNSQTQYPVLDVLRDAIELKRLNNGLMKPLLIDDLIGDAYALLYTTIGPTLPPLPSEVQPQQPPAPISQPTAPLVAPQPPSSMSIASMMHVQADGANDAPGNTPFTLYHSSQLQPQQQPQPIQPEPAVKSRAKAVGRREIGRRAEGCIQKAVSATAPQTMPIRSPPLLNATIPTFSTRTSSPEKSAQPGTDQVISRDNLHAHFDNSGTATAAASVNNDDMEPEPSAPASIQDDADDESELSELDEEEVQEMEQEVGAPRRSTSIAAIKPLFPNLSANRLTAAPVAGQAEQSGRVASEQDMQQALAEAVKSDQGVESMDVDSAEAGKK